MITILGLMQYRKDEFDFPVNLYTNGRGMTVDYQRDFPLIELLKIPKSIIESLCPKFLTLVVKGNNNEIILTDKDIELIRDELKNPMTTKNSEIISNQILKFITRYEPIKESCHLAFQSDDA